MRSPIIFIFLAVFLALIGGASVFIVSSIRQVLPMSAHFIHSYLWVPFVFFPVILVVLTVISNLTYIAWTRPFYIVSSLWLPALIYLFIGALLLRIYLALGTNLQIIPAQLFALLLSAIIVIAMIYGIWKANTFKVITSEIDAPALHEAWHDKTIVLFSDSHLGLTRSKAFMAKIVTAINELSADAVFIAGDLIDGPVFPYERDLAPLAELKTTYGTFYAAGNHDEYNRQQLQYLNALSPLITVLNDKKVLVNQTQIIGIEFAAESFDSTKARLTKTGYDATIPSIVILHDPKNVPALAEAGVTLSFSGHTHGGQFWPFTLLVNGIYKNLTKGAAYIGNHAHFTTVGVGTWGPLFRLGTQPEIVIIKIK